MREGHPRVVRKVRFGCRPVSFNLGCLWENQVEPDHVSWYKTDSISDFGFEFSRQLTELYTISFPWLISKVCHQYNRCLRKTEEEHIQHLSVITIPVCLQSKFMHSLHSKSWGFAPINFLLKFGHIFRQKKKIVS